MFLNIDIQLYFFQSEYNQSFIFEQFHQNNIFKNTFMLYIGKQIYLNFHIFLYNICYSLHWHVGTGMQAHKGLQIFFLSFSLFNNCIRINDAASFLSMVFFMDRMVCIDKLRATTLHCTFDTVHCKKRTLYTRNNKWFKQCVLRKSYTVKCALETVQTLHVKLETLYNTGPY